LADRYYTSEQLLLEKWINQLGWRTNLEVSFPPYSVDIFCPDLNLVVEVDGPQHYKKANNKRDEVLKLKYGCNVLHIKTTNIIDEKEGLIKEKLVKEFEKIKNTLNKETGDIISG